jgi:hypothetical protein
MKSKIFAVLAISAVLQLRCSQKEKSQNEANQGTPIDSTVIGKDTTSVDVRDNIEQSDEQKRSTPGRDTINSDEKH